MPDVLTVSRLDCFYGDVQVLFALDLTLRRGEVHCLLGRNGAGKTTALKAIMGLVPIASGSIKLSDRELTALPAHEVPRHGVAYVPQGRRLFAEMTVAENIEIGLMARGRARRRGSACSTFSRYCASDWDNAREPCPAANSRCWPWRGRSAWSRTSCCSMSPRKG